MCAPSNSAMNGRKAHSCSAARSVPGGAPNHVSISGPLRATWSVRRPERPQSRRRLTTRMEHSGYRRRFGKQVVRHKGAKNQTRMVSAPGMVKAHDADRGWESACRSRHGGEADDDDADDGEEAASCEQ